MKRTRSVVLWMATAGAITAPASCVQAGVPGGDPAGGGRTACGVAAQALALHPSGKLPDPVADACLGEVEQRTFQWFWDRADPATGLIPDREPSPSPSSIAACGFGLSAYVVGAERGWVSRAAAATRTHTMLQFFAGLPQGAEPSGQGGHHGFFYHFVDMQTGARAYNSEVSSVDTALLIAGALTSATYFDRNDPTESAIRELADRLYRRVEWTWLQPRAPLIGMGWTPESGFHTYDWRGYNEAMLVYLLALGSPTHPVDAGAWGAWESSYAWAKFQKRIYWQFAPLFGHQYSHVWVDFRGIKDRQGRRRKIDYFENSRRATYAHRRYAIKNPLQWDGYGPLLWGLTASDGPTDETITVDGRPRKFFTYAARGASKHDTRDDGTLAPTAVAGSLPFAPEITIPALVEMTARYGDKLYGEHGFVDAFNPTLKLAVAVHHGYVVPGVGWFDRDRLGIDQGPIVLMIENHRSGLLWNLGRRNHYLVEGLRRAGFGGGWLSVASTP